MTVSTTKTSKAHGTNGTATVFGFDFPVLDASYLVVTHTVGASVTTLLLDRDYTVQGVGDDAGGSITTTDILTGGTLLIRRQTPILQETLLRNQSKFHAEVHEAALDRLTMVQQELLTFEGEAIQGPPGPPGAEGPPGPAGVKGADGGATRTTITITATAATGTVALGKVFTILMETASAPGRFRLYRTIAARDADLARAVSTDEAARLAGCVLEDVFTDSALAIEGPDVPAHSGSDGLCAWSWSGALDETITLEILVLEA